MTTKQTDKNLLNAHTMLTENLNKFIFKFENKHESNNNETKIYIYYLRKFKNTK